MIARHELGTFTDPDGMVTLLRARQVELGLSNEDLEQVCGFAPGQVDKYLGPSRVKTMGAFVLAIFMDALGVSGTLYVDPAKVARLSNMWAREGRRRATRVRPDSVRISRVTLKRARPEVLRELGRRGGMSRWALSSPEEKAQFIAWLNSLRAQKRLAGKSQ